MNSKIGIVAPAHRPQNWMELYESIGKNDIDYELVFVGPNPPDYKLPENFRFIKSMVKPSQCCEIAFRNTNADLVMNIADDSEFKTEHPLDKLFDLYKSCNSEKVIVSPKLMFDGDAQPHIERRFFTNDESSPVMAYAGLMSRKYYRELGGIDRNFIAIMWDLDIYMRAYASGGTIVLSDVYINEDSDKSAGSSMCRELWRHDRGVLEDLWTIGGKVHFNRAKPVEPFSNVNILTASQGPRGRWRGNKPLFFEKIEDKCESFFGYSTIFGRINRGIRKPSMYLNYAKRMALHINRAVIKNND